ncbi:MAG: hypothetical protein R2710_19350 [Acidimicrobiales bacterium]
MTALRPHRPRVRPKPWPSPQGTLPIRRFRPATHLTAPSAAPDGSPSGDLAENQVDPELGLGHQLVETSSDGGASSSPRSVPIALAAAATLLTMWLGSRSLVDRLRGATRR